MLMQLPSEYAKASEKYENGKSRAISGVEPFHYAISPYGTERIEDSVRRLVGVEKNLTRASKMAAERKRCIISLSYKQELSMLDYSDFNVQHTPHAQAAIFNAAAIVGHQLGFHKDWIRANKWIAEAKFNATFSIPQSDDVHKSVQGMFSGTRNTDLINTLLNRHYLMIARKYVLDYYTIGPDDYYAVHQGDDVWISNKKRHWAALLYYTLNEMGLVFNPMKQMFGHHRGEFLRIYYFNGNATGYSVRCVVIYLLRPLQSIPDVFLEGWVQTLTSGFATMTRRGITLPILNVLYDTDVFYHTSVKAHFRDEKPVSNR